MTGEEFNRLRRLRDAYESLAENHAFITELAPLFGKQFSDALAGLRNRDLMRAQRDEHLVAAENAEALTKHVGERIAQLRAQIEREAPNLNDLGNSE